jgi:hypothetical protein
MLSTVILENFRAFERLELHGLRRVNLLVGVNNAGKTSVLEAIRFLVSPGTPEALLDSLERREEFQLGGTRVAAGIFDPAHLFFGRVLGEQQRARVSGRDGTQERSAELLWTSMHAQPLRAGGWRREKSAAFSFGELAFRWDGEAIGTVIPVGNGIDRNAWSGHLGEAAPLLTASGMGRDAAVAALGAIALSAEAENVVAALRIAEPALAGIASVLVDDGSGTTRGSVIVRLGDAPPVPIGSLGDGMWRLLGLALSLARAKGGVLFVDEIDTGLHYTALPRMWKMVAEAAERLDIQVFATTHSKDAVDGLATLGAEADMCLLRVERGRTKAVSCASARNRRRR